MTSQLGPGSTTTFNFTGSEDHSGLVFMFDPYVVSSGYSNFSLRSVTVDYTPSAVPAPATILLIGPGLCALAGFRKRFIK